SVPSDPSAPAGTRNRRREVGWRRAVGVMVRSPGNPGMLASRRMAGEYVMATSDVGPDSDGSAYRPISVLSPIYSRAMFPRRIGLSRGSGGRAGDVAVLLAGCIAGCCVAPPDARELLAVGYRTPEQAISTFQVAEIGRASCRERV